MADKTYTIVVSRPELQLIVDNLGKDQFNRVYTLVNKLISQARTQDQVPAAAPANDPAPQVEAAE